MALTPSDAYVSDGPQDTPGRLVDLRDLRAGLVTTIALALTGVPLGLLWQAVAPRATVTATPDGALVLADIEDKAFIAADALLFLLGLALGLLAAVVGSRIGRRRGPGTVVGLVLGCYLAALVAAGTGSVVDARQGAFADQDRPASAGVQLAVPNALLPDSSRSQAVYLGAPAAAALMFGLLGSLAARREEDRGGAAPEQATEPYGAPPYRHGPFRPGGDPWR